MMRDTSKLVMTAPGGAIVDRAERALLAFGPEGAAAGYPPTEDGIERRAGSYDTMAKIDPSACWLLPRWRAAIQRSRRSRRPTNS
jgi:hypothetical protein